MFLRSVRTLMVCTVHTAVPLAGTTGSANYTGHTVPKPIGQQFKKEVHIRNLPSLFKKLKPTQDILEDADKAGLIGLFTPEREDR